MRVETKIHKFSFFSKMTNWLKKNPSVYKSTPSNPLLSLVCSSYLFHCKDPLFISISNPVLILTKLLFGAALLQTKMASLSTAGALMNILAWCFASAQRSDANLLHFVQLLRLCAESNSPDYIPWLKPRTHITFAHYSYSVFTIYRLVEQWLTDRYSPP